MSPLIADLWSRFARSNSKENAYCKLCKCVISLSNMGEKALWSHANGKKHSKRLEGHDQIKNLFKPKTVKAPVDSKSAASLTSYNVSITKSLDAYFQDSAC